MSWGLTEPDHTRAQESHLNTGAPLTYVDTWLENDNWANYCQHFHKCAWDWEAQLMDDLRVFSSNTRRGDMSFQFHRCASKFCRQVWWPCSPVSPTWRPTQSRYPPVVNTVPAIEVHMCMYFLCRKPVTVKRNILHAGYEILYLPTTSAPPVRDISHITASIYQVFSCLQQPFHIQT